MIIRARISQLLNLAFWVLVAIATVRYALPKWREFHLSSRLPSLGLAWIGIAMVVLLLHYLAVFALWCAVLRVLGGRGSTRSLFRAFCLSQLPKYVPGKVLGPGLRTRLTAGAGISYSVAFGSLVWEMGLALSSAACITLLGLGLGVSHDLGAAARWLLLAFPVTAIAGLLALRTSRLRNIVETWLHPGAALRNRAAVAALLLGYCGIWLLYTTAHWMVARAITPLRVDQMLPLLVALATSWAIGALSVLAPAGLGVREGALFVFARGLIGAPAALLFVTLSRLLIFAVELLLTLVAVLMTPRTGSRTSLRDTDRDHDDPMH